jgi:ribosomal protein L32
MSKKKADAGAAGDAPPAAAAARTCPECGSTTWKHVPLTVEPSQAGDRDSRQAELDAVVAKRGPLQKCAGCGYKTHAGDSLAPAGA